LSSVDGPVVGHDGRCRRDVPTSQCPDGRIDGHDGQVAHADEAFPNPEQLLVEDDPVTMCDETIGVLHGVCVNPFDELRI
jgi:hypothetical protein